ncbi:MAG: ribosome maturation factor RimM [Firmicutes bacterium]|nr:ribosome maturation factor RimM [Bacillota bacterium]
MTPFLIGQVLKPQGIKGELKVKCLCDVVSFAEIDSIFVGEENKLLNEQKIKNARLNEKGFAYLQLLGVDDRNSAEAFKDKLIFIDEENVPKLEDGVFFIKDLIGCEVFFDGGEKIGIISSIDDFGSADVITVKNENKELRFPHLEKIVKEINIDKKQFIVIKEEFNQVVVD